MAVSKLEKECGLSNGSVSKWDKSKPNVTSLVKISTVTNIPMEELLKAIG